ncbi:hypothetical protein DPMN_122485 [Dreissena polymorpha]|uniref:Uncharacterized protein n=1 Tax=Dreissena polymorpha TaxID=45954 RepID=A0A9D4GSN2_DREPO|nr:hypothetical protein DPMN_122485 [Dreissena polymorpha]
MLSEGDGSTRQFRTKHMRWPFGAPMLFMDVSGSTRIDTDLKGCYMVPIPDRAGNDPS